MRGFSIFRRGRYFYAWYADPTTGRRKKISTRCERKHDALLFAQRFVSDLRQPPNSSAAPLQIQSPSLTAKHHAGRARAKSAITVKEFRVEYLRHSRTQHKNKTYRNAESCTGMFAKFVGENTPLREIAVHRCQGSRPISRIQYHRILKDVVHAHHMTGKIATHSMRKTFADRMYDNLGQDIFRTQRALGHRNINSTVQYLSFREADIEKAILAM